LPEVVLSPDMALTESSAYATLVDTGSSDCSNHAEDRVQVDLVVLRFIQGGID